MEGRFEEAMTIQHRLVPLHDALFAETSPGPVKYAASLLGKTSERCRLPLAPLMEPTRAQGAGGDDRSRAVARYEFAPVTTARIENNNT